MLRAITTNDWWTVLILVSIVVLAFAKYAHPLRFNDFATLIGNSKYLKIYSRDQKFIDQFDSLIFINLVISGSIFLYICYQVLFDSMAFDLIVFFKILVGLSSVILIKVLIDRLIGSAFEIDALIESYVFQKTNYKNYTGLFLLPVNILLIYAVSPSKVLIICILAIVLLINLIGFFTSVRSYQKLVFGNFFYFILYLCALEIGPYIILYKVLEV